ncbi:MAG: hypothetical protein KF713_18380 [Turneriella sp.]|nr:hypothetical protein [Turneriella sp.]
MPALRIIYLWSLFFTVSFARDMNRVRSVDYPGKEKRLEVLKKHLKLHTSVSDAAFDLYDVNLNADSSIPGPTHRDYRVALRLPAGAAARWLTGIAVTSFPHDAAWCHALLAENIHVTPRQKANFWTYTAKNKTAFFFKEDNILCLRIFQD